MNVLLLSCLMVSGFEQCCPSAPFVCSNCFRCTLTRVSIGLHFNPPAYKIMYEEVSRAIASNYPDLAPDNIPMNFPSWEDAPG